jgi:hypothetical protein
VLTQGTIRRTGLAGQSDPMSLYNLGPFGSTLPIVLRLAYVFATGPQVPINTHVKKQLGHHLLARSVHLNHGQRNGTAHTQV